MSDCIFCKIASGGTPTQKVEEMTNVLAFYDISPSADTHILVVPKRHIASFMDVQKGDLEVVSQMFRLTQKIIKDKGLAGKYKIVVNGGEYQFVPHLHWHILGGNLKKEV